MFTVETKDKCDGRSSDDRTDPLISKMAHALETLAKSAARYPDEAISVRFFGTLERCNCAQDIDVAACPRIPTVAGDILYVDIDKDDFPTLRFPICDALRLALEPFIMGVGWIQVHETLEGLVISLRNAGKI